MSYDSWKTSAPEPRFGTCARCRGSEEDHDTYDIETMSGTRVCPDFHEMARAIADLEEHWNELDEELQDVIREAVYFLEEEGTYEELTDEHDPRIP